MNAEILAVGTELLLGDIVNTNAQFLSRELAALGVNVYFQSVVGDNAERMKSALELAFKRAELVITTGGLGPTNDDITKETAAEYFALELVNDEKALDSLSAFFRRTKLPMPKSNLKQALVPEGSITLHNTKGTAPGSIIEKDGKIMIMLPGPHNECIPMFKNGVIPFLKSKQNGIFISRTLRLVGIGESSAAERIRDILEAQTNPTVAPYAKTSEVHLRITAKAESENEARALINPVADKLYDSLGEYIYAEDEQTLEKTVLEQFHSKGLTLAVAESCTGGMISARLTEVAGASAAFKEGCVTYSNEAKISRLGVSPQTLEKYGAVSEKCAAEMAEGIAKSANTDVGLSVTGLAGPGGATKDKPVGLVFIGLYYNGKTSVSKYEYTGDRARIRSRTAVAALDILRKITRG